MENSIHEGHRERLRKTYCENGANALNDYQLLELLLTYTVPRRDTNPIAHALLERFSTLANVLQSDTKRLTSVDGVGERTATFLRLIGDTQKRVEMSLLTSRDGKIVLHTPLAAARYASIKTRDLGNEVVLVVCLNTHFEVITCKQLQTGTIDEATIYPRAVVETALFYRAHSVLMIHNHPSGNPLASKADEDSTKNIQNALRVIDISLRDHLIAAGRYVYSFSSNCIIDIASESVAVYTVEQFSQINQSTVKVMENYEKE